MTRRLWICAAALLWTSLASAQTPVPSPTPTQTRLGWTHDGADTTSWRIRVDGVEQTVTPTRVAETNDWVIAFPALTPGTHTLHVGACREIPNFPALCGWSDPLGVVLVVAPTAPTGLTVIPPAG